MRKLGRRLGEDERFTKIRLLNLVPEEPPGSRFNELVRAAKAISVSKPTLWRHLMRFEKLGLVTHEGRFYRKNPLHGFSSVQVPAIGLTDKEDKVVTTSRSGKYDLDALRSPSSDHWIWGLVPSPDPWGLPNFPPWKVAGDPEQLHLYLKIVLTEVLGEYLFLLRILCDAPTLSAAREIASLLVDGRMTPYLMMLARHIWEHKNEVQLEGLDGKELNFVIQAKR